MSDENRPTEDAPAPPPMPGWVKALGVALLLIVVVVVLVMVVGGGQHGPGRHG